MAAFAGKQLAGTWILEIKDGKKRNTGTLNSWSITATWGGALHASGTPTGSETGGLTSYDVAMMARSVIDQWSSEGVLSTSQITQLNAVEFEVTTLGESMLGFATWGKVTLDANAAGFGWFKDASAGSAERLATAGTMDLYSVIAHELGHLLGGTHDEGLGSATLSAGVRTGLDFDHLNSGTADRTDNYGLSDRASALRRLDSLSFDLWMRDSTLPGSTPLTTQAPAGGFSIISFIPGSARTGASSIFDEDSGLSVM